MMKVIRDISNIKNHPECVVSIGNYDGLHLGHQSIISELIEYSTATGLPGVVITFEPYPMEYFSSKTAPARLTDFRQKIEMFDAMQVDHIICLRFNQSLASMSARTFVEELLVKKINIRGLIVGNDFRFGNNREGNIELLKEMSDKYGFELIPADTFHYNGMRCEQ